MGQTLKIRIDLDVLAVVGGATLQGGQARALDPALMNRDAMAKHVAEQVRAALLGVPPSVLVDRSSPFSLSVEVEP